MNYFQALLGKLYHAGTAKELRGGLNFKSGFLFEESANGYDITAIGEGGVLSNDPALASAVPPAAGASEEASRSDHEHGTAVATGTAGARHGHIHSDTLRDHNKVFDRAVWYWPTGNYVTDEASLNAAAVTQRLQSCAIKLGRGQFNVRANQVDWTKLKGALIEGVGVTQPSSVSSVTDGTIIKIVTQIAGESLRAAGSWMLDMSGSWHCVVRGIHFKGGDENFPDGAVETCVKCILKPAGEPQPQNVVFENCVVTGNLTHVATSTTSRTLARGTVTFAGVTGTFPDSSTVIVRSAGGNSIGRGTVRVGTGGTLASGTLSVDFSEVRHHGAAAAHTDWCIHQATDGFDLFGSGNCEIDHCTLYNLRHGAKVSSAIGLRVHQMLASGASMFDHMIYGDSTPSGCHFNLVTEFGVDNWASGADLRDSQDCRFDMVVGDSTDRGHVLELSSNLRTIVRGGIAHTSATEAAIRADGTLGLDVRLGDARAPVLVVWLGKPHFLSGNPTLTFAGNTITRGAGSWTTDGFGSGGTATVYNSASNNVTRNVVSVTGGGTILTVDGAAFTAEGPSSNICVVTSAAETTVQNVRPVIDCPTATAGTLYQGTAYTQLAWRDETGYFHHSGELEGVKLFSIFGVQIPFTDIDCSSGIGVGGLTANMHVTVPSGNAAIHGISVPSDPGVYGYLQTLGYFGAEPGAGAGAPRVTLLHDGNFTCTIADNSATDGTAARRVRTGTGANIVLPACTGGQRFAVELLYHPAIARWVVESISGPAGGDVTGWLGALTIANLAVTSAKLAASAVVDSKVDAAAAIAGTKISPSFGAQNVAVTNRDLQGVRTVQYSALLDNLNSGSAKTIALGNGSLQKLTLTATCTLTTTAPAAPCAGSLYVYQDGTGGWGLTFPTSRWPSGTAAGGVQPSTGVSELTAYDWEYDGTTIAWTCRGKLVTV